MRKIIYQLFPVILAMIVTSALWFLASVDGSLALMESYISANNNTRALTEERNILKLETEILELKVKKRFYKAQLRYLEGQGF